MTANLFAILTSPGFGREFAKADPEGDAIEAAEGIVAEPYLGNVDPADHPAPTTWELGTPEPLAELGGDAE